MSASVSPSVLYRRSLFYFIVGSANTIGLRNLDSIVSADSRLLLICFELIVIMSAYLVSVTNLCCFDMMVEGWFMVLDALIFSSLTTICLLSVSIGFEGVFLACSLSAMCACFHLIYNSHSSQNFEGPVPNESIVTFSNTSMGASDFVYVDEDDDPDFNIDELREGFRVRMDKLPQRKLRGDALGDGKTLTWTDFHSVEHLIDSSRYVCMHACNIIACLL